MTFQYLDFFLKQLYDFPKLSNVAGFPCEYVWNPATDGSFIFFNLLRQLFMFFMLF